jgi:hypothetical protein
MDCWNPHPDNVKSVQEENRSEPSDLAHGPTVVGSREKCTREVPKPSGPSIGKDTWQELSISLTRRARRSKNILFELVMCEIMI